MRAVGLELLSMQVRVPPPQQPAPLPLPLLLPHPPDAAQGAHSIGHVVGAMHKGHARSCRHLHVLEHVLAAGVVHLRTAQGVCALRGGEHSEAERDSLGVVECCSSQPRVLQRSCCWHAPPPHLPPHLGQCRQARSGVQQQMHSSPPTTLHPPTPAPTHPSTSALACINADQGSHPRHAH